MFGLAAGVEVNVGVITRRASSLDRGVLNLLRQPLKSVVNRLWDQRALLDPSFRAVVRTHPGEAALALEDLDAITVLYYSCLAKDCGDMVAQNRLRGGDIGDFLHAASTTAAAG